MTALRQFCFSSKENRDTELDGKPNAAPADKRLIVASQRRFAFRIDGTTEVREKIVGHVRFGRMLVRKKTPPVVPAGLS